MLMFGNAITNCLCPTIGSPGEINGQGFGYNCAPFPSGVLAEQNNPSCNVTTYTGGLHCCSHGSILLDADQTIPDGIDTFYIKMRFYFEEFNNHKQMFRLYHQTEANHGEYDIVKCPEGTPSEECIDEITSRWTVGDMMQDCSQRTQPWCADQKKVTSKGIYLMYAGGHCHAPSCISLELYNAETGHLICRNAAAYGENEEAQNEEAYVVAIPPCVWGFEKGLQKPPILHLGTTLYSIKRTNSTNSHHGDMASWQMRGALVD